MRGKLMDSSPENNPEVLVARKMMDIFGGDTIFSGISKKSGTVQDYMTEAGHQTDRDPMLTNDIDTILHEYGILSSKPSSGDGLLYSKSYASHNTKLPAICQFSKLLLSNSL